MMKTAAQVQKDSPGREKRESSSVYVFDTHVKLESAIRSLSESGFDVKKLSMIGKGYRSEARPVGFYTADNRIQAWGGISAFWGDMWGLLLAPAVFWLPGFGLMAMAGPVVSALVGKSNGAGVVDGVSALCGALTQSGVPTNQVAKYEAALKADKYVLMVHGNAAEVAKAHSVLARHTVVEAA
jgi:hypothetical protein